MAETTITVVCAQCKTEFFGFHEGQADGCASQVIDGEVIGHYGSEVADLMSFTIDPSRSNEFLKEGIVCDECITHFDAAGGFSNKRERILLEFVRGDETDRIEGLECELDSALDLMVRVARGEQSVHNMGEWVSLNFPKFRERLPVAMQAIPPTQTEGA